MKYLQKLSAVLVIAGILASNVTTFAASINGTTASTTGFATNSIITITSTTGNVFDGNEITAATITNLDTTDAGVTLAPSANAALDASDVEITVGSLTDNTSYIITFTTAGGDFGTTTLRVGTPTNDTFTVTGSVQPVLKFGISSTSDSFGVLDSIGKTVSTNLEVGTNAIAGVNITAESTNGGLLSNNGHTINGTGNDILYAAEEYNFSAVAGASDSIVGATISGLASENVDLATPGTTNVKTIYSADKPQNYDTAGAYDVVFSVEAKIAESTPTASDYTDVIIFTATANF